MQNRTPPSEVVVGELEEPINDLRSADRRELEAIAVT
jgi:hypothetical protein